MLANRTALITVIWLLALVACKQDPPPPIAPQLVVTRQPDVGIVEPPSNLHGIAIGPPKVLHERGDFRVMRQDWGFEMTSGTAWIVRAPRYSSTTVVHSDEVVALETLVPADDGPWAAINGGFYEEFEERFRPMGLVVSDGAVHSELTKRGGSGIFYVDESGPRVVHRSAFTAVPTQALQSIDRIIDASASVVTRRGSVDPAMRSAIALSADHVWLVIAAANADIHETESGVQLSKTGAGLPLWAFADYVLRATNAVEALNLDGGVSTQLVVRDGDFRLDVRGVSGTINAIVIRPTDVAGAPLKR